MPDRLGNALTFAKRLSATYGEWRDAKPDPPQAKVCPICRREARLVSDHDHATGYNRDWICAHCNSGLGFFRDDPRVMLRAARYIKQHRALNETLTIEKHMKPSMAVEA